jgi:hypothetical protein
MLSWFRPIQKLKLFILDVRIDLLLEAQPQATTTQQTNVKNPSLIAHRNDTEKEDCNIDAYNLGLVHISPRKQP